MRFPFTFWRESKNRGACGVVQRTRTTAAAAAAASTTTPDERGGCGEAKGDRKVAALRVGWIVLTSIIIAAMPLVEPTPYVEFGNARERPTRTVQGVVLVESSASSHLDRVMDHPYYTDMPRENGTSNGIYEDDNITEQDEFDDIDDDETDGHPIFAANCEPILPNFFKALRRRDDRDDLNIRLVYSSPVSYHCWNVFLFAILPLSTILSMAVVYSDRTVTHQIKTRDMILLWVISVTIPLLMFLLLPRRVDLYSNSSLVVVTYLWSHEFTDVVAAYDDPTTIPETWSHPRIKCTTNFVSRVLLRRTNGGWDVVVSPQDTKGLIDAVQQLVQARDATTMQAQVYTI